MDPPPVSMLTRDNLRAFGQMQREQAAAARAAESRAGNAASGAAGHRNAANARQSNAMAPPGVPFRHHDPLDRTRMVQSSYFKDPEFSSSDDEDPVRIRQRDLAPAERHSILQWLFHHEHILVQVTSYMTIKDVINLYSVSKTFHYLFNCKYQGYITRMASSRMGAVMQAFPPAHYPYFCIRDPSLSSDHANLGTNELPPPRRLVPSFRYLQMADHREKVISQIILMMAFQGHHLPKLARDSFRKIWFIMDLPTNAARLRTITRPQYITTSELHAAHYILFKLDMVFTDPVSGYGPPVLRGNLGPPRPMPPASRIQIKDILETIESPGLFADGATQHGLAGRGVLNPQVTARELVLAHRDLRFLWRVLRREKIRTRLEPTHTYAAIKYRMRDPDHRRQRLPILGIPCHKVGALGMEYWGNPPMGAPRDSLNHKLGNFGERFSSQIADSDDFDPTGEEEEEEGEENNNNEDTPTQQPPGTADHVNPQDAPNDGGGPDADWAAGQRPLILSEDVSMLPYLLPPDELIIREGVRRNLQMDTQIWDMLTYGYVEFSTGVPKGVEQMTMGGVYEWLRANHPVVGLEATREEVVADLDFEEGYEALCRLMRKLVP